MPRAGELWKNRNGCALLRGRVGKVINGDMGNEHFMVLIIFVY